MRAAHLDVQDTVTILIKVIYYLHCVLLRHAHRLTLFIVGTERQDLEAFSSGERAGVVSIKELEGVDDGFVGHDVAPCGCCGA